MEFKLNRIEPEVRQRVNELTSTDKIHTKTGAIIDEDSKKKKEENEENFEEELKKEKDKTKQKIEIEAIKISEVEVPAYKEIDNLEQDENRGHFLDIRK
jgi:hypothetical protein